LLVSACKTDGMQEPATSVVKTALLAQSSFCQAGSKKPSMLLLTDDDAYKSVYSQTRASTPGYTDSPPAVDFSRFSVIVVYMGSRQTAGYQVGLASRSAIVGENDNLDLLVSWTEPPDGALLAQVMTSPCMLVTIQKGSYSAIRVIDEAGKVRITGVPGRE
jgi:hypothetical protein